jgi:hypothetical protein
MFHFHGLSGHGWFNFVERICGQARVSVDGRKEFGKRRQKWDCDGSTLAAVFRALQDIKPDSTIAIWNHSNAAESRSSIINLGFFAQRFDSESVFTERRAKFAHDRLMYCRLRPLENGETVAVLKRTPCLGRGWLAGNN